MFKKRLDYMFKEKVAILGPILNKIWGKGGGGGRGSPSYGSLSADFEILMRIR